jgi:SAM-dependent methyltransferase
MYQDGTIYTLSNNPLGIGPGGAASSATDFHKEFDSDLETGLVAASILAMPFSFGVSGIIGAAALAWGTYDAVDQYSEDTSHGEHFGWSNPNTRWDIVGDATLAVNWATLGAGAFASGFANAAGRFAQTADTLTYLDTYRSAMAGWAGEDAGGLTTATTDGEPVATDGSTEGVPIEGAPTEGAPTEGVPAGDATPAADGAGNSVPLTLSDPAVIPALRTLQSFNSGLATGFNWAKVGLQVAGYGLGTVQTVYQIDTLSANWGKMSFGQQLEGIGNIAEGVLPFLMEPILEGLGLGGARDENENENENENTRGKSYPRLLAGTGDGGDVPPDETATTLGEPWEPSFTDRTLVVGGGHAFRQPGEGEVFLNVDPEAQPDIVADIRSVPMIPSGHFSEVYFERVDYTLNREVPPDALAEAYRILKAGGTLLIHTGAEGLWGADERNLTINNLESLGFQNISATYSEDPATGYKIWAYEATVPDGPEAWAKGPAYFVHLGEDGTMSAWFRSASGTINGVDSSTPWNGVPPSEVRIIEISNPDPAHPDIVATHLLTRNAKGAYDGVGTDSHGVYWYETPVDDPFGQMAPEANLPAPEQQATAVPKVAEIAEAAVTRTRRAVRQRVGDLAPTVIEGVRAAVNSRRQPETDQFASEGATRTVRFNDEISDAQAHLTSNDELESLNTAITYLMPTNRDLPVDGFAYKKLTAAFDAVRSAQGKAARLLSEIRTKLAGEGEDSLRELFQDTFNNNAQDTIETEVRKALLEQLEEKVTQAATDAALAVIGDFDGTHSAAERAPKAIVRVVASAVKTAIDQYQPSGNEVQDAATDAVFTSLREQAQRSLTDDQDVTHVTGAVDYAVNLKRAVEDRKDAVAAGELIRTDYHLYELGRGSSPGGYYEEGAGRSRKVLLKQPLDPDSGNDGKQLAYATLLHNALYRTALGRSHVSDVRVVDMRLHPEDPTDPLTYGTASPLIAKVKYPSASSLSAPRIGDSGLLEYLFTNVLTGTVDPDPLGNHNVGFADGRATAIDVTPLGFNANGDPVGPNSTDPTVGNMLADLEANSVVYRNATKQDRVDSLNNVLNRLSKDQIDAAVAAFDGKIDSNILDTIRDTLRDRHDALTAALNTLEQEPDVVRPTFQTADTTAKPIYVEKWSNLRLSPEHQESWTSPRRFAAQRRALGVLAWGLAGVKAAAPDANFYPAEDRPDPDTFPKVTAKQFDVTGPRKALLTISLFLLAGWGGAAEVLHIPDQVSEILSLGRGFLNIAKYSAKFRKAAYTRVLSGKGSTADGVVKLMTRLQGYHGTLEKTLEVWQRPQYEKYLTVPAGVTEQLRINTEDILGQLAQIVAESGTQPIDASSIKAKLTAYFKAQDAVMGIGGKTSELQFFAQSTNPGAVVQGLLVLFYLGAIGIDVHKFVAEGSPDGLEKWLTTLPDYIDDLGKIGSMVNALNLSVARWTAQFPFKPKENSPLAKLAEAYEPYSNLFQGIGNTGDAFVDVYKTNIQGGAYVGLRPDDAEAFLSLVAGVGYLTRWSDKALRSKSSASAQAGGAAAAAAGGEAEADFELAEFVDNWFGWLFGK